MTVKVAVTYGNGSNLRNNYSVVEGETRIECYEEIRHVTNGRYAFSYIYDDDFLKQIERYSLTEVPLQPHNIPGLHES